MRLSRFHLTSPSLLIIRLISSAASLFLVAMWCSSLLMLCFFRMAAANGFNRSNSFLAFWRSCSTYSSVVLLGAGRSLSRHCFRSLCFFVFRVRPVRLAL